MPSPLADLNLHPVFRYRRREGLSIHAFAERAGVTRATVARCEDGRIQMPTLETVYRLSAGTDGAVSVDEIVLWHARNARRAYDTGELALEPA